MVFSVPLRRRFLILMLMLMGLHQLEKRHRTLSRGIYFFWVGEDVAIGFSPVSKRLVRTLTLTPVDYLDSD